MRIINYNNFEEVKNAWVMSIEKNEKLPKYFWSKLKEDFKVDLAKYILIYLCNNNIIQDVRDFSFTISKKYNLCPYSRKFKSIYEFTKHIYGHNFMPWEFKARVPDGFWDDDRNVKDAMFWFVKKLKEDRIIKCESEIPKVIDCRTFTKYGLCTIMSNRFNSSPYKAFELIYPGRFNRWDYNLIGKDFYNDPEKIREIMEWFVSELNKREGVQVKDIPRIVNINKFKEYGLYSFLIHCFRGRNYDAFNFLYPNKWMPWEFKCCESGYWDDINNQKYALMWLVDKLKVEKYIEDINEIPNLPLYNIFEKYNLMTLAKNYKYDYHKLFSIIYNDFTTEEFKLKIAKDGTKVDSFEEIFIHNWLIDNFENVEYLTNHNKNKFRNELKDENYIPDWKISNNIIIEYFGYYSNVDCERFTKYRVKTKNKVDFFNSLESHHFVPIFREDIPENLDIINNKIHTLLSKSL